jgi:hypothetical protein
VALLNPSPALPLPLTMWTAARPFIGHKPLAEDEVLMRISPPALRKAPDPGVLADATAPATSPAIAAVKALKELNMLTAADGKWSWAGAVPKDYTAFGQELRKAVLADDQQDGVEDLKDQRGSRDLLRGLAWFLTKDPVSEVWTLREAYQDPTAGTDEATRIFVNDTRWNGFRYWAEALGLAAASVINRDNGSPGLVCNATVAVGETLMSAFSDGENVPARQVVNALRERIPVLPGGRISRALGHVVSNTSLDRTTSYALLACEDRGWIELLTRADARDIVQFADLDGHGHRNVTHVSIRRMDDV